MCNIIHLDLHQPLILGIYQDAFLFLLNILFKFACGNNFSNVSFLTRKEITLLSGTTV